MEIKQQTNADAQPRPFGVETVSCPNCQAALVRGMRFCRMCGYRLGEGLAEYTETRRFDGAMPPVPMSAPYTAPQMPAPQTTTLAPAVRCRSHRGRRLNWLMWPLLALIISSASGGAWVRRSPSWLEKIKQEISSAFNRGSNLGARSFFGTKGFTTVDQGALMDAVVPNSPAERAGLIGGDIITRFDGHDVTGNGDMTRLLRATPIGKAVEVVFLRDGEMKVVTLNTASSALFDMDNDTLMGLTGEQGFLGIDGDYKRVPVPGTNLYGVQLAEVMSNRPADLAGLRAGDIIIEFNGTPIRTTTEFEARIHRAKPGDTVNVTLIRNGQQQELAVKMGRR